ncbi:MAG: molybdopterin molybdotransferase MoeA [Thermoplasmata archaeon]|nr:molybdopterin molybdotransferase MoeA [Thermoplasmata archaeon]
MRPFGKLIPMELALRRILGAARPVERVERVPLGESLGRVSAETYHAPISVPRFARATWDGYAFRSASTREASRRRPTRFRVVGEVFADRGYTLRLGRAEAVAIAAGGRLPAGADTMAIFEELRRTGSDVLVPRFVRVGERIAATAADFRRGHVLVRRGDVLDPATVGSMGAAGRTMALVFARPRVAILPNGNELVLPGHPLRGDEIYETNNLTLGAIVRANGGIPRPRSPLRDDPRGIEAEVRRALARNDLVLLTGGSSVGEHDYAPEVLPRVGRVLFHGIAVRPGKPTIAAVSRGRLVIGMPGHPTSALSNSFWLLSPLLRRLGHLPGNGWVDGSCRLARAGDHPSHDLASVLPLRVVDGWGYPTYHGSHAVTGLRGVNAFIILAAGSRPLRRGQRVSVHLLPEPIAAPQRSNAARSRGSTLLRAHR